MGRHEAEDCINLISRTAAHLQSCSFDPQDSCGLHARFLRLLLQTPTASLPTGPSRTDQMSGGNAPSTSASAEVENADSMQSEAIHGLGAPLSLPPSTVAFDPMPQLGAMATDPGANSIDLNALFTGKMVANEFAWAFPAGGFDVATPDVSGLQA